MHRYSVTEKFVLLRKTKKDTDFLFSNSCFQMSPELADTLKQHFVYKSDPS